MSKERRSALATIDRALNTMDRQSDRTYAVHQKFLYRYSAPVAHLHQRLRGVPHPESHATPDDGDPAVPILNA